MFDQTKYDDVLPAEYWSEWIDVDPACFSNPEDDHHILQVILNDDDGNEFPRLSCNWYWNKSLSSMGRILKYRRFLGVWSDPIPWNGGDCPIPNGESYIIKTRAGSISHFVTIGDKVLGHQRSDWEHSGDSSDIVSYRFLVSVVPEEQQVHTDLDLFRKFFSTNPVM